jgi:hypothetical protein
VNGKSSEFFAEHVHNAAAKLRASRGKRKRFLSVLSVEEASNAIHLHEIKKFVTNSYLTPDSSAVSKYLQNESKADYKYMVFAEVEGERCVGGQRMI